MNATKFRKMVENRRNGFFKTEETIDEATLSFKQMTKDDVAFTLQHHTGLFCMLNKKELLSQMRIWKSLNCVSHKYNSMEITIEDKKSYMFIIQPKDVDDDTPISPLAIAFGMMVSGFAYITPNKDIVDLVCHYLAK